MSAKSIARAVSSIVIAAASLLVATSFAAAQAPTPTPAPAARRVTGHPFPPPQYIPPHDYDQRNIKLDLRFDWEREQAIGTATITLAPAVNDLRRVDFDAAFMTISGTALAAGTPLKFEYDVTKEKLSVFLDHAYQPGDQLTIV